MTDELKIRLAAAAAHGFINAAAFNPIHDEQAARIVNEIAEALWPGQFVKVEIKLGVEPEAISVPAPAIQLGPQGPYLFVVKDGVAELRQVAIKRTQGGESVIGKGLEQGEQVVVDGQLRLVNGANVTIRPATPETPPSTAAAPPRG